MNINFKIRLTVSCATVLIALGAVALYFAVFGSGDWHADFRTLGAVLLIGGIVKAIATKTDDKTRQMVTAAVEKVMQPLADAYEAGAETGYDRGYDDGRRSALPVVVPIFTESDMSRN